VTALGALVSQHEVTWIASAMSDEDRAVAAEAGDEAFDEQARDGSHYRLRLVSHDPDAYERYYRVIANPLLWFLQHGLWELSRSPRVDRELRRAWEEGYAVVNRNFAAAVVDELDRDPGASVFLHDYHLYLAPKLIREQSPDAALAHFVHIPWPSSDQWGVLPRDVRVAIHEGVLGFHSERWRTNFLRSAQDLLDVGEVSDASVIYQGRRTLVNAHPISVDTGEFDALRDHPDVRRHAEAIAADRPEQLVVRVDRTDPSKNILRGFEAFGRYLELHPEAHGRVGMLALLDPSRLEIPVYAEYVAAIEALAAAVNDQFGRNGWRPIDLRVGDDFHQSVAAYTQYDVLLVNAIFDGLNLVAKEAPLVNERDGVLVLSENTGVHAELQPWALTVNPFDVEEQAEAIHQALSMSADERRRRIEGIRAHVREHDLTEWIGLQLADLGRLASPA
jgi:trehalose 6-phosphate synthase